MAEKTEEKPAGGAADKLKTAADRLREAARWLVVSAGAAAAAVIAGISFSSIGELTLDSPDGRFWVGWTGGIAALIGVLGALTYAMSLASQSTVTAPDLLAQPTNQSDAMQAASSAIAADTALAPWNRNFATFVEDYRQSFITWKREYDAWANDTGLHPNPAFVERADFRRQLHERVMSRLLEMASFVRLKHSFETARWWIAGLLLLGGTGLLAVTWATNAPDESKSEISAQPFAVRLDVPDDQQDAYRKDLSGDRDCTYNLEAVPAIVLSEDTDKQTAEIITEVTRRCTPIRRTVPIDQLTRS